jgi:hypothetical protein
LVGQKIDTNTNYCIGIFKDNALYLNPITNFMQFKHDFSTTEGNDIKKKVKDKPHPKKGITLTPSEMIKEEDKWTDLKYYKKESIHSGQIYERLSFEENEAKEVKFLSPADYFNLLFNSINKEALVDKLSEKLRTMSFKDLQKQSLPMKVEYILRKLHIISYDNLRRIINDLDSCDTSDKDLVETALKFSRFLKNGNLILRTELKYDDTMRNELALKRNYIINLLQNAPEGINKSEIKFLNKKELDEMLSEFVNSSNGKLYLKENSPNNIIELFKSYYEKDVQFWESLAIKKNLTNNHTNVSLKDGIAQSTSKINTEQIYNLIAKVFTKNEIVSYNNLVAVIKNDLNLHDEKLIADSIAKTCFVINNTCYSIDVGDAETNKLRKKLLEFFVKSKTAKKAQIKDFLSAENVQITDSELTKILKSIARAEKNIYSLKTEG